MNIRLLKTLPGDLKAIFQIQADKESSRMAAFTALNHNKWNHFEPKWLALLEDPGIVMKTVWIDDVIVGSVLSFDIGEETNVSYGLARKYWGQGIMTHALQVFLEEVKKRRLYARTAFDNLASQRVLEKCGFVKIGTERGFAHSREEEMEEYVYCLY